METIRRVVDNGRLTPEESQQSSKEARQVYEDVMALRDNLTAAREEEELQETLEVLDKKEAKAASQLSKMNEKLEKGAIIDEDDLDDAIEDLMSRRRPTA